MQIEGLKPIHVGIDPYLTLDSSSNIEQIFKETVKPADENGDMGGSAPYRETEQFGNVTRNSSAWTLVEKPLTL